MILTYAGSSGEQRVTVVHRLSFIVYRSSSVHCSLFSPIGGIMSLGKQAAQGVLWNYAAFVAGKGVLFVATVVLARVLSPEEFGLVGMALLVITMFDLLRDFGLGAALIHRQRDEQSAA